jgi:hypothetical protein
LLHLDRDLNGCGGEEFDGGVSINLVVVSERNLPYSIIKFGFSAKWIRFMSPDVFLSYSSKEKPVADDICVNLEAAGVRRWIAPRDITPGEGWPMAITRAIPQSRVMILVFFASSNSSEDVGNELFLTANK